LKSAGVSANAVFSSALSFGLTSEPPQETNKKAKQMRIVENDIVFFIFKILGCKNKVFQG
jgi:hypothetical protein